MIIEPNTNNRRVESGPRTRIDSHVWRNLAARFALPFAILVAIVIFSLLQPYFLTTRNIFNVIRVMSIDGMLAVGMTFVILGKGIDLSVGSITALSGAVAVLLIPVLGLPMAVLAALGTGVLVGLVNGTVITTLSIQPFVATLAMMVIVRGLNFFATGGYPIIAKSAGFEFIGNGYLGPVPIPVIVFVGIVILSHVALNQTKFGPQIFSIGGNEEAALRFGVNTKFVTIASYMICGLLAAVAGVILSGRLASASPLQASGYELDAIAAVVIGGTSLMGGRGSIAGTVGGVAIIAIMNNGLDMLNVNTNYQFVIKGLIILVAVSIDAHFHKKRH